MSRILFAWELGGGYGHLGPFLPVARKLVERGHDVTLAVRDIERANIAYNLPAVRIVPAPLCIKTYGGLDEPPLNYAEILMRYGYLDAPLLTGMLRAWRGVLDLAQADVLVVDHAPTALLAARGTGRTRAVFGSAFPVPPSVSPTPNMRPWIQVPEARLASSDASVLKVIGASLPPGSPPLTAIHGIFEGVERFLAGTPELDPYGSRDPAGYLGLYATPIGTAQPGWPEGGGPRVFAYLHGDYRHLEATLAALAAADVRCLIYLFGASPTLRQKYPRLLFSDALLDLDTVLAETDVCVCHGNSGTMMSILRAGKPMLLLPTQLEHFLLSVNVEKLGIARVIHPDTPSLDIGGVLGHVLERRAGYAAAANAFASRHREPPVATIVERVVGRIEALALETRGKQA